MSERRRAPSALLLLAGGVTGCVHAPALGPALERAVPPGPDPLGPLSGASPAVPTAPGPDYRIGPADVLAVRVHDLEAVGEVCAVEVSPGTSGAAELPSRRLGPRSGSGRNRAREAAE